MIPANARHSTRARAARKAEARHIVQAARRLRRTGAVFATSFGLLCGVPAALSHDRYSDRGEHALQLRRFIDQQAGGIDSLKVPARNTEIPVLPGKATEPDQYQTTEAKRFRGNMLFHDPMRASRININENVPANLPAGTALGGTLAASDPRVQAIVRGIRYGLHVIPRANNPLQGVQRNRPTPTLFHSRPPRGRHPSLGQY
jgi:hypothetical protein